jgi:hypothetical protein
MSVSAISGPSGVQSSTAFEAAQKAALNRLLAAFANGLQNDHSAVRIQFLAQQIVAAAQALGHTVDLPDTAVAPAPSTSRVSAVTGVSDAGMGKIPPGYA